MLGLKLTGFLLTCAVYGVLRTWWLVLRLVAYLGIAVGVANSLSAAPAEGILYPVYVAQQVPPVVSELIGAAHSAHGPISVFLNWAIELLGVPVVWCSDNWIALAALVLGVKIWITCTRVRFVRNDTRYVPAFIGMVTSYLAIYPGDTPEVSRRRKPDGSLDFSWSAADVIVPWFVPFVAKDLDEPEALNTPATRQDWRGLVGKDLPLVTLQGDLRDAIEQHGQTARSLETTGNSPERPA